jgi:hypothetical protein
MRDLRLLKPFLSLLTTSLSVREEQSQLHATVTETVDRVIGWLGATGMTVTQRFSYQFGFAAKVTPAALEWIVNSPDDVAVEKNRILKIN